MFFFKDKTFQNKLFYNTYFLTTDKEVEEANYTNHTHNWDKLLNKFREYEYCQSKMTSRSVPQWMTLDCDNGLTDTQLEMVKQLHPTNILRRKSNGHCQVQWLLASRLYGEKAYNWYRSVHNIFKTVCNEAGIPNDMGNVSTTIQNPYNSQYEWIYRSNDALPTNELDSNGEKHLVNITWADVRAALAVQEHDINGHIPCNKAVDKTADLSNSRNREFVRSLDSLLLRAMHHGQDRVTEDMIDTAMATALRVTGKTERLTKSEVNKAVRQAERFCHRVFNKGSKRDNNNKNILAQKMATITNGIQKCRKVLNIQQWKDGQVIVSTSTAARYKKVKFDALLEEAFCFATDLHGQLGYEKYYSLFSEVKQLWQLHHLSEPTCHIPCNKAVDKTADKANNKANNKAQYHIPCNKAVDTTADKTQKVLLTARPTARPCSLMW